MKITVEQTYKEEWRGKEEETLLFSLLTIIFYKHFPVLSINYDVLHSVLTKAFKFLYHLWNLMNLMP